MNPDFTVTVSGDRIRFRVRVTARAARAGVGGIREGALLVRVTAAPVDGSANVAVRRLLADALRVPFTLVVIAAGHSSRSKTVTAPATAAAALRSLADPPTGASATGPSTRPAARPRRADRRDARIAAVRGRSR